MPLDKLRDLCERITKETHPDTLTRLINELTEFLREEQNEIRAKIRKNSGGYV